MNQAVAGRTSLISRRRVLGAGATGLGGMLAAGLVGCGDDDEADDTPPPSGTGSATATSSQGASPTQQASSPTDGSYYSALGGTTYSIDPQRAVTPGGIIEYAYDGLISYDDISQGTMRGIMAQGLPEQPDDLTFTFKLRPGIAWQNKPPANGRAFTMDDLKWNLERQMTRKLASGEEAKDFALYATAYQYIERFETPDESTVTITLKSPRASWLDAMCASQNVMVYREVAEEIEKDPNKRSADLILGTGAYIVEKYDAAGLSTSTRNPDWFLKKSGEEVQFFDDIRATFLAPDTNARRAAFEQKQLDWLGGALDAGNPYPPQFIQSLIDNNPDLVVQQAADPNNNRATIMSFQRGPFANPQLRQAYFLAIDRQVVIDSDFAGQGRVDGPIPWAYADWAIPQDELAEMPGYRSDKELDLKEARALWDAGGGPAIGAIPTVISEGPQGTAAAEWFGAMMKQNLNSDLEVQFMPSSALFPHLTGDTFTFHIGNLGAWNSPDPRNRFTLSFHSKGGINFAKYNNPQVDALIEKATASFDREDAIKSLREAQDILLKDANGGSDCLAGGTYRYVQWPYLHMDHHNWYQYWYRNNQYRSWIDQTDESFSGRPTF